MRRRTYLGAVIASSTALAGCSDRVSNIAPDESTTTTAGPTDFRPLTDWTATADCDPMHEDIIKVEWVRDDLADDYAPIRFADLSPGERDILEIVVTDGGYSTCEHSAAFRRFVERVMAHRKKQSQFMVHLYYRGTYYGLYVQQGDQVFSGN